MHEWPGVENFIVIRFMDGFAAKNSHTAVDMIVLRSWRTQELVHVMSSVISGYIFRTSSRIRLIALAMSLPARPDVVPAQTAQKTSSLSSTSTIPCVGGTFPESLNLK